MIHLRRALRGGVWRDVRRVELYSETFVWGEGSSVPIGIGFRCMDDILVGSRGYAITWGVNVRGGIFKIVINNVRLWFSCIVLGEVDSHVGEYSELFLL